MKRIVLTGGGTGGHLFPLVAVADALLKSGADVELIYVGPRDNREEFSKREIRTVSLVSSKLRRYFSLSNFVDVPKFFLSLIQALGKLYFLMPDAVFSKSGPGALAVILAARFYAIPIVIHESDAVPGITNKIAGSFAKKIELSFEEAAAFFKKKSRISLVGNPVRGDLIGGHMKKEEARGVLGFTNEVPLILVMGGSQGATRINQFVFDNLEELLKNYQVYHQVGSANFEEAKLITSSLLHEMSSFYASRYKIIGFLGVEEMKKAYAAADIILSRAGAASIFEIALFGKPSLLIPLPEAAGNHQEANAYSYAKTGAAVVVGSDNFKFNTVATEIGNILGKREVYDKMSQAAFAFARPDAAAAVANDVLNVAGANSHG